MISRLIVSSVILLFIGLPLKAQDAFVDSFIHMVDPQKLSADIEKRAQKLQEKIITKSIKTLSKLQRQEEKIYNKMLSGKDSLVAKAALADINSKYQGLRDKIKNPPALNSAKAYIPKLDSLSGALKFLDQNGVAGKVKDAVAKTESLQQKFQQADEIKKFIQEQRQRLRQQLENLGMVKELKKINKEVYYYSAQIREYRLILKDSKKRERKALEFLSKTKLFKDFMRKNSMLASLFRLPGDPNDPLTQTGLAGLQTRAQVNNLIQQQLASGGPNAQQQFRENIQAAQAQVNQLKNRVSQLGGGSSDDSMPDGFKPNPEKLKPFHKRLEYGLTTQSSRATNYFPVRSDLGLTIAYRFSPDKMIGLGVSYSLGLGKGWNHIRLTSEAIGMRSFADIRLRGSLWITCGYEMNYRTAFRQIDALKDFSPWAKSGLVGVSKTVSLKSKVFKKTTARLLWDFLSYSQVPRSDPVVFRVGYNF